MKRFISLVLSVILLWSTIGVAYAADAQSDGVEPNYILGLQSYVGSDADNYLLENENFGYWSLIEDFEADIVKMELLNTTDVLIDCGTEPDVQKYTEVLVNIIATYDQDNASDIAEQHKSDNLKSALDYAIDVAQIGANALDLMVGMDKSASDLEKWISIAVSGLSTATGNIDNWIEALSNLETIVQNYTSYDKFLALIEKQSTGDLRTAASNLRTSMKKAMTLKLDAYGEVLDANFENYTEFFFNDVFFEALKLTSEYESDESFKVLVDCGSEIADKVKEFFLIPKKAWDLGAAIGTFVGNVAVGGEDIINRLHELMALRDIGNILCNELKHIASEYERGKYDEKIAENYFIFSKYLIGCRLRGEYCCYSIVATDSGLLSRFSFKKAEEAYQWYVKKSATIVDVQEDMEAACTALLVPITSSSYEVGETSEWYIFDESGELCSNYTLRVTSKERMHIGAIEEDFSGPIEYVVTKPEPLVVTLESGYWYGFEIVDNLNEDNELHFLVEVNSSDGLIEMIEIETEFTSTRESSPTLQVSWIKEYGKYGDSEVLFEYNDAGNIKKLTYYSVDENGNKEITSESSYSYDADGHLVLVQPANWPFPKAEYRYNGEGQLISYSAGEGSTVDHDLEYNAQGQLVRMTADNGITVNVTSYTYNDAGQLISETEVVNMPDDSPSTSWGWKYEYDTQGRKSVSTFTDSYSTSVTEYCYDYAPFIITKHNDSWGVHLQDSMGEDIWSGSFSVAQFITNEEGVLIRVEDAAGSGMYSSCEIGYSVDVGRSESPTKEIVGRPNNTGGTVDQVKYDHKLVDQSYYDQADILRIKYTYDQIEILDQTLAANAINSAINQDVRDFMSQLTIEDQQEYAQSPWIGDGYFWYTAESEVTNNSKGVLSICVNTSWCMGGVHNLNYYGLNYDLNTGAPIELAELFGIEKDDLARKLKDIAWTYLSQNRKDAMHEDAHETLYGYSLDELLYYFKDGELILTFPTYSLGYGASGSFTVPTGLYI